MIKRYIRLLKKDIAKGCGMKKRSLFGRKARKAYDKSSLGISEKYFRKEYDEKLKYFQEKIKDEISKKD